MSDNERRETHAAAAMREALDYCRDTVADLIHHIGHDEDYLEREMKELVAKCNTALAAPPRNCDKYANHNEAMQAFDAFVREQGKLGFINPYTEGFKWLFALATEPEGGAE